MSEWSTSTLEELCAEGGGFVRTGPFGSQLHQSDYVMELDAVPVVMPKDMRNGRVDQASVARVSDETAERLAQHLVEPGDVILSRRGDVGRSVSVRQADIPTLVGTGSIRIHLGTSKRMNARYFEYFMRSRHVVDYLEGQAVGATMPNLNAGIVNSLPVFIPPKGHQDNTATILGSIDDLIENNRRRIEVLEEMAQAIYREWFVHFRYPGHDDATFVDSPLGPIPEGWEIGPLTAIANLTKSSVNPSRTPDVLFAHYSLPSFDEGHGPAQDLGQDVRSGKFALPDRCVLLSKLNPRIPRVWLVDGHDGLPAISSTEFLVLTATARATLEFVYLSTRADPFQKRMNALTGGTSGSHQRAKPSDVMALGVAIPPITVIERANASLGPSLTLQRSLHEQNIRLTSIRDLLLPKLVTGEIDVSGLDLDALVGAAS